MITELPHTRDSVPQTAYPLCFHGGAIVRWNTAVVHANCLALRYALSVFEGIRLYLQADGNVRPFQLEAHTERLHNSLRLMRLNAPVGSDLSAIIDELTSVNHVTEDSYARVSVSPINFGDLGSAAETCLTVCLSRMGRKNVESTGLRVAISAWQRTADLAFPAAAKNISSYAGPRLALLDSRDRGFDNVVLTTPQGFLCESPTAALVIVRDGVVLSPPITEGVLPSITRAAVFDICRALAIEAREQRLSRTDAYLADEAFLCGTALEIAPIAAFDTHSLRQPFAGWQVTPTIIDVYSRIVRGDSPVTLGNSTQGVSR